MRRGIEQKASLTLPEAKNLQSQSTDRWLVLLGLLHAYLVWSGDILFSYGLCGLFIYSVKDRTARILLALGIGLLCVGGSLLLLSQFSLPQLSEAIMGELSDQWQPSEAMIAAEIEIVRGSGLALFRHRFDSAWLAQTSGFLSYTFWRASGLMLIGMALYKRHLFHPTGDVKHRFRSGFAFSIFGFSLTAYGVYYNTGHQWALEVSMFGGTLFNYVGSIFQGIGYLLLLIGFCQSSGFNKIKALLTYAGQLSLSLYIGQSLICTFLFTGMGLGLFGHVERGQQWLIVLGIVVLQILFAALWRRHFQQGPLEWLWRRLTYPSAAR